MRTNRQHIYTYSTYKTENITTSYVILVAIETKDVKHVNTVTIIEQTALSRGLFF